MSKTKIEALFAGMIVLALVFFSPDVFQRFSGERKGDAEKENIKIEIIREEGILGENSAEAEMEEKIIESDAEQVEVKDNGEGEPMEAKKPEIVAETLPPPPETPPTSPPEAANPDKLKIGYITDLHVRSNSGTNGERVLKPEFSQKISYFIEKMNNFFLPDFILVNGDIIEGTNANSEKGMAELSSVKNLFDKTALKKFWSIGNHDLRSVNKNQFMKALKIDYVSKVFEMGNYKIIILDSSFTGDDEDIVPGKYYTRGHVSSEQLEMLERELSNTGKRTIVFLHHPPLWDQEGKSNDWFPDNAKRLKEIFSQNKVFAVFSGHIEDLFLQEIDGVKYFISPGIKKNEKYQGAFSEITISKNKMIIEMSYLKNNGKYRTIRIKED